MPIEIDKAVPEYSGTAFLFGDISTKEDTFLFGYSYLEEDIEDVCFVRYNRRPSHHTVQSILTSNPPLPRKNRRYLPYAEIANPAERRLAVIQLHAEGLRIKSIAEYIETSRQTIYTILKRWLEEGVKGLDDKSHAPKHPKRGPNIFTRAPLQRQTLSATNVARTDGMFSEHSTYPTPRKRKATRVHVHLPQKVNAW